MDDNCPEPVKQWLDFPMGCGENLDFSMDSLKTVDECLGMFRDGMKEWPPEKFQANLNAVVLGWGAYIGEVVRRAEPAWSWVFPAVDSGELPYLAREGPGGLGRMTWTPINLALARLHEAELDVALLTRKQMEDVAKVFQVAAEHPELLREGTGSC